MASGVPSARSDTTPPIPGVAGEQRHRTSAVHKANVFARARPSEQGAMNGRSGAVTAGVQNARKTVTGFHVQIMPAARGVEADAGALEKLDRGDRVADDDAGDRFASRMIRGPHRVGDVQVDGVTRG